MAEEAPGGRRGIDRPPTDIVDVEAEEVLDVEEDQLQRGQLIAQPEIGETDAVEGRADHPAQSLQEPEASVMVERRRGIEEKEKNQGQETQRLNERVEIEVRGENEAGETQEPEHGEKGADLEKLLVGEMIARIDLEDQHVIDAGRGPTVDIDADENDVENDEKRRTIEKQRLAPSQGFRRLTVVETGPENDHRRKEKTQHP